MYLICKINVSYITFYRHWSYNIFIFIPIKVISLHMENEQYIHVCPYTAHLMHIKYSYISFFRLISGKEPTLYTLFIFRLICLSYEGGF